MSMVRCLMCGMSMLSDAASYEKHIEQHHSMDGYRVEIKPKKSTMRSTAEIVAGLEISLGLQHFITPEPVTMPVTLKYICKHCGPTNSVGYWLINKTGICEPCLKIEANTVEVEEIQYHD